MCLAVPGRIVEIQHEGPMGRLATVDFSGVRKAINLDLVPEAAPGDYVLVHVGFAIQTLDEAEAMRTLEYLEQIGEAEPEANP